MNGNEEIGISAFGKLEIPTAEAQRLSDGEIVLRLVDSGVSRLSAERIVQVERGHAEASRARRHTSGRFQST